MALLVLDIEGTLFKTGVRLPGTTIDSTIWQAIAYALGPQAVAEEVETHRKWHNREYASYLDWMKDTIRIHQKFNLRENLFRELSDDGTPTYAASHATLLPPRTLSETHVVHNRALGRRR